MVVGSDAAALTGWAVELQAGTAPGSRRRGSGSTSARRSTATATTTVARSTRPRASSPAPAAARCSSRGPSWNRRRRRRRSQFDRIGEVRLKGFSEPTELFTRSARERRDGESSRSVRERGRASGLLAPGTARWWRCSRAGATRRACSTCSWRCSAPRAVGALHVNYGLREDAGGDERHCARCARGSACALEVQRAEARSRRRDRARATCRRGRATCATPPPRGSRASDASAGRDRPHRQRPGRDDPLPPGGVAGASRAARGMRARDGRLVRPLLGVDREQTDAYCRARGLEWRETPATTIAASPARACVTSCCRRCAPCIPRPRPTCCARRRCLATRRGCSTRSSSTSSAATQRSRWRAWGAAGGARAPGRRAPGGAAAETYVPQAGERVAEMLALARRGGRAELHVGGARRGRGRGGALEMVRLAARDAPTGPSPDRARLPGVATPARASSTELGEVLVTAADLQRRVAELGERDLARLRRPLAAAGRRAEGRGVLPERPDALHRGPGRGRLHGGRLLRLGDRLLGGRAHPQGPRRRDRRPRRADRRGHRRLGPDAAVPAAQPRLAQPAHRSRCARC